MANEFILKSHALSERGISLNLRVVRGSHSFSIRLDTVFRRMSGFNLACRAKDGSIIDLDGSVVKEVGYTVERASHIMTANLPLTSREMYIANGDGYKQVTIGLNQLNGTAIPGGKPTTINTQFNDIKINYVAVISARFGYLKIPVDSIVEFNDGKTEPIICFPELEYYHYTPFKIYYSTIETKFGDFDALKNGLNLEHMHEHVVQAFGYDAGHDGLIRVHSLVLRDTVTHEPITCEFNHIFTVGRPDISKK